MTPTTPGQATPSPITPPWREPAQERSRARVARMVEAARALIAAGGIDALSMEGVARGAGVPIGSVYQFFPDRTALLARILRDLFDGAHAYVSDRLGAVETGEDLLAAGADLVFALYRMVADDPTMFEVWHAVGASPLLRQLDLDDTARTAALLCAAARPLVPQAVSDERLYDVAFLHCDLLGHVIRSAIARGPDGDRLITEYVAMSTAHFHRLLQGRLTTIDQTPLVDRIPGFPRPLGEP